MSLRSAVSAVRDAVRETLPRLLGRMAWNRAYRTVSYLRSALWVVPLVAMLLELAVINALYLVDRSVTWNLTGLDVAGATTLFQSVITLTLSFVIFTFGSLLVAIQIAGGQLTPRIIATTLLRDRVIKYTVGLNVFTLLFAISALNRLAGQVSQLIARELGERHLPERVEIFALHPRFEHGLLRADWCASQYLSGMLGRKARTPLFLTLSRLSWIFATHPANP